MTIRYRHREFGLLRSTTDPGGIAPPADLDLEDTDEVKGRGLDWLAAVWARAEVRDALATASPELAGRIDQILAAESPANPRDLRRAVLSVASYTARWSRRVTPFGLFAGVAPVIPGTAPQSPSPYRAAARADADWITALVTRLERDPALRPHLHVVADNTRTVRDGRAFRTLRPGPGTRDPGTVREASVRYTRPVQAAMELAARPVRFGDLASRLGQRFPSAAPEKTRALLDGLLDTGFLITSLRPPMTAPDPLQHLADALRAAGGPGFPGVAAVLGEIEQVLAHLRAHDECADPGTAAGLRRAAARRMEAVAVTGRCPLAVDVRLGARDAVIPPGVLDEAAAAAGVLLRLTTRPFGSMAWVEYHGRFRERYGPGALVPVRELLSDAGLGYPDGYLNTRPARPAHRMLSERDAGMLSLVQQAAADGAGEIVLTEPVIRSLVIDDESGFVWPQRAELGVTIQARSAEAVRRGDFGLTVVSAPRLPTSMAGRFAHVLTRGERDLLAATYLPGDAEKDAVAVQLSFPPVVPHNENVVRAAPLLDWVLPLGEHPPAGGTTAVSLDDLAVTADAAQMYLCHRPTGQRVIPRIPHALEMTLRTPPLARFLAQVADARTAVFGPLDPGAARVLPYLPRFRYRRTILSPARWLLTPGGLAGGNSTHDTDGAGRLDSWRERWQVPARVIMCDGELRMPLNLEHALDRSLLRARLKTAGRLELREDAPPEESGWLGRPAELLIPLALTDPPPRPLPVTAPPGRTRLPGRAAIVCARLAGNPDRFGDLIAGHLPRLAASLDGITERWWIRRHRDMIHPWSPQHVEFCARLTSPGAFAQASAGIAEFAAGLAACGLPGELTFAPYHEHPARYGQDDALTAAEHVFAADTRTAIAQLAMTRSGLPGQALAAASMTRLAAAFAPDPAAGHRLLTDCLDKGSGPLDRHVRDLACRLADPDDDCKALRAHPGGDAAADAWKLRDEALAVYHGILGRQRDPRTVLRTLLHEHHMRAVGLDPGTEKQTGRLARAAALQQLALEARR